MKLLTCRKFVLIWQTSKSFAEVMRRTGTTKANTPSKRAAMYRKKGIKLKYFRGPLPRVKVAELNELIQRLKQE